MAINRSTTYLCSLDREQMELLKRELLKNHVPFEITYHATDLAPSATGNARGMTYDIFVPVRYARKAQALNGSLRLTPQIPQSKIHRFYYSHPTYRLLYAIGTGSLLTFPILLYVNMPRVALFLMVTGVLIVLLLSLTEYKNLQL